MDAPSLYDLLMQATPDDGRAMQDALRKRAAVGALIQGIGGSTLGGIGSGMIDSADKGMERIDQQAQRAAAGQGQRLKMAMDAQREAQQQSHQADVFNETRRHNLATERNAAVLHTLSGRGTGSAQGEGDIGAIADAIESGIQAPDLKSLYKYGAPLRAELGRRKFDLAGAQNQWTAVQKNLSALNSTQQTRLRQAIGSAPEMLSNIENLYNEWEKLGGASNYRLFNKGALAASKQVPGRMGEVAQALEANISDLVSDLGTIYQGGNTPTEHAMHLALQNLDANWTPGQFRELLKQARKNIQYRANAMNAAGPVGTGGVNRYAAQPAATPEPAPAPAAGAPVRKTVRGVTYEKRPDGWYKVD